jgi:formiminotetrahydrofolate cyclodeaminase
MENIDRDAQSYEAVLRAYRLPKSSDPEQAARNHAVEVASKEATAVPLETAEMATAIGREIAGLSGITIPQAAADLRVAASLTETARFGGIENVRANLPSARDEAWQRGIEARLQALQSA